MKITPSFWFDNQAEEAALFYAQIFPNSTMGPIHYQDDRALTVWFSLSGQPFSALNGGPMFSFNPSVSFYTVCESPEETERLWEGLSSGGKALMPLDSYPWSKKYGWVQDKFGVSWQLTLGNIAEVGQKISPALMFNGKQHGKAEAAIQLYESIFKNAQTNLLARYEAGDGDPAIGTIKHAQFSLDGNIFIVMDSSHMHGFTFNEAISFIVHCPDQAEVDHFWEKLGAGGEEMMCGWLKDRFGVAWQIIPDELMPLLSNPDPVKARKAVGALMTMRKIDLESIRKASENPDKTVLTVQAFVEAPVETVWEKWTSPQHIIHWNFASDEWHAPAAEHDLTPGGSFSYRMEARDGSMGFDYSGKFLGIDPLKRLDIMLDDDRKVQVHFSPVRGGTFVMENFEAEGLNSLELQKQGWQAILNNFKHYVEENLPI